jgi:hypothetical protein
LNGREIFIGQYHYDKIVCSFQISNEQEKMMKKKNYYQIVVVAIFLLSFSGCGKEKLPDVCERVVQSGVITENGIGFQTFFIFDGIPRNQYDSFQNELKSEQKQPLYQSIQKWLEWTEKQMNGNVKCCALIVPYETTAERQKKTASPRPGIPAKKTPKFDFKYKAGPNDTLEFDFANMWMKVKDSSAKISLPPIDGKCYLFNAPQKTFELVDVELKKLFQTHKSNFQEIFDDEGKNTSIAASAGSWNNYYFAKQSFSYRSSILNTEWYSQLKEKMDKYRLNLN